MKMKKQLVSRIVLHIIVFALNGIFCKEGLVNGQDFSDETPLCPCSPYEFKSRCCKDISTGWPSFTRPVQVMNTFCHNVGIHSQSSNGCVKCNKGTRNENLNQFFNDNKSENPTKFGQCQNESFACVWREITCCENRWEKVIFEPDLNENSKEPNSTAGHHEDRTIDSLVLFLLFYMPISSLLIMIMTIICAFLWSMRAINHIQKQGVNNCKCCVLSTASITNIKQIAKIFKTTSRPTSGRIYKRKKVNSNGKGTSMKNQYLPSAEISVPECSVSECIQDTHVPLSITMEETPNEVFYEDADLNVQTKPSISLKKEKESLEIGAKHAIHLDTECILEMTNYGVEVRTDFDSCQDSNTDETNLKVVHSNKIVDFTTDDNLELSLSDNTDSNHSVYELKLPDADIHMSEETSSKDLRYTCTDRSFSSGYPFNTQTINDAFYLDSALELEGKDDVHAHGKSHCDIKKYKETDEKCFEGDAILSLDKNEENDTKQSIKNQESDSIRILPENCENEVGLKDVEANFTDKEIEENCLVDQCTPDTINSQSSETDSGVDSPSQTDACFEDTPIDRISKFDSQFSSLLTNKGSGCREGINLSRNIATGKSNYKMVHDEGKSEVSEHASDWKSENMSVTSINDKSREHVILAVEKPLDGIFTKEENENCSDQYEGTSAVFGATKLLSDKENINKEDNAIKSETSSSSSGDFVSSLAGQIPFQCPKPDTKAKRKRPMPMNFHKKSQNKKLKSKYSEDGHASDSQIPRSFRKSRVCKYSETNAYRKKHSHRQPCRLEPQSFSSSSNDSQSFRHSSNIRKELSSSVLAVNKDSAYSTGNISQQPNGIQDGSSEYDMKPGTKMSCPKLLIECFYREMQLSQPSSDFYQQLKVLRKEISNMERRFSSKEVSRRLYIEHQDFFIFGLDDYFDRLRNGPPPTTEERMHYEWLRLATFHNYTGQGNAIALARNGFYHDNSRGSTYTRCYLCEANSSSWEMFSDVSAEHMRQSPNCPFHSHGNEESSNISISYNNSSESVSQPTSTAVASDTSSPHSSDITTAEPRGNLDRENQATDQNQTQLQSKEGESIPQQPTEDSQSGDRSSLALAGISHPLGQPGLPVSTVRGPRLNYVASGARSNDGHKLITPVTSASRPASTPMPSAGIQTTVSETTAPSQLQPTDLSSLIGSSVGAGAYTGLNVERQTPTGKVSIVTSAKHSSSTSSSAGAATTQESGEATTSVRAPTSQESGEVPGATGGGGGNDPLTTVVINPKHPDYLNIARREESYRGWPEHLDQTPRRMSEAGFFFVGIADFTRCFCCGGGLRNWEPGDDPILEHTRWFPQCEYILKLKGERYVNAVQRRHRDHMAEQQRQQNEPSNTLNENRTAGDPLATEAAAVLREMGYSDERSKEAILAVRRQTGSSNVTAQEVLTWLLDDEDRQTNANTELGVRPPPSTFTYTTIASTIVYTSTPSTIVYTSTPSSLVFTGTSIPSTVVDTTFGISVVNHTSVSNATSIVNTGTSTSTVNSTSTMTTAVVQSGAHSEEGNQLTGRRQTGANAEAMGTNSSSGSIEKQSSGESKSAGKEAVGMESKSAKKKNAKKKAKGKGETKSSIEGSKGADKDKQSLQAENEKLRDMQTCKICMENPVNTTLLPCGHLVTCENCASRLVKCPICRKRIEGTVKTYMS